MAHARRLLAVSAHPCMAGNQKPTSPRFGGAFLLQQKTPAGQVQAAGRQQDYKEKSMGKIDDPAAIGTEPLYPFPPTLSMVIRALLRFYYDYLNVPKRTYMPLLAASPATRYRRMQDGNARKTRKNHPEKGGFRLVRPVRFERMAFRVGV
jgi:hypothetical protein